MRPVPSRPTTRGRADAGAGLLHAFGALGLLLALAGLLMPGLGRHVEQARRQRAEGELAALGDGCRLLLDDHDGPPAWARTTRWWRGPGAGPAGAPPDAGRLGALLIEVPPDDASSWRGPYVAGLVADPWGHAYLLDATGWTAEAGPALVLLSAGPDGRLQTGPGAEAAGGDDLLHRRPVRRAAPVGHTAGPCVASCCSSP